MIEKNPDGEVSGEFGSNRNFEDELHKQRQIISDLTGQLDRMGQLQIEIERKSNQIREIRSSLSWKIGHFITRVIGGIFFFIPNLAKLTNRFLNRLKSFFSQHYQPQEFSKIPIPLPGLNQPKPGKLNLADQMSVGYGAHRSGWSYAISNLKDLHNENGVLFDSFIERTFFWHPDGVKPHTQPWVGVIHVPPKVPKWFQYEQSNEAIFNSSAWKESLQYCKGLYTMSYYHKRYLENLFDFPVCNLIHPTEFPDRQWNWKQFEKNENKKIVQIGWWLRKLHSIFLLPTTRYTKIFLRKEDADLNEIMRLERENMINKEVLTDEVMKSATTISFLPNDEYDTLLSENIVFLDVYDSSANNAIIECMARNTPILVNRIEPVIEYLGNDYPLYYDTLEEAATKADDFGLIRKAHLSLVHNPLRLKLTGEFFRKSVIESEIYQRL
ncbi:MAG: hypothetical protein NT004_01220 [Bacteroidetes bacterium]|nr:hypothetical protein [Bacteroidota bacterium]